MVPFAGYSMPVHYPMGILQEHKHTRALAGLFDVSHMGQVRLIGQGAGEALETLVPGDIQGLKPGRMRYTQFTDDQGGILDDLMVTNAGDHLYLVVNAACKDADIQRLSEFLAPATTVEPLDGHALLALQGPAAMDILSALCPDATKLKFMESALVHIVGADCRISRSGYTGEDGVEISVPAERAEDVATALLADSRTAPIGLGARDSLRLEAGLCLYGHDIDSTTTPVEAGLTWSISKRRRADGGFPGASIIQDQINNGPPRRRVGLQLATPPPAREGAVVTGIDDVEIGHVTSGAIGPSVGRAIAMGYVRTDHASNGTAVHCIVRGKPRPGDVTSLPFVTHQYVR